MKKLKRLKSNKQEREIMERVIRLKGISNRSHSRRKKR